MVDRINSEAFYSQHCEGKAHQDACSDAIAEICGDADTCQVDPGDEKISKFVQSEAPAADDQSQADATAKLMALLGGSPAQPAAPEQPAQPAAPASGVKCPEAQELKDGKCVDKKSEAKVKGFTWADGFHFSLGAGAYDNPFNVDTTSLADAVTKHVLTMNFALAYLYPFEISESTSAGLGLEGIYRFAVTEKANGIPSSDADPGFLHTVKAGVAGSIYTRSDDGFWGFWTQISGGVGYSTIEKAHLGAAGFEEDADQVYGYAALEMGVCLAGGVCPSLRGEIDFGRRTINGKEGVAAEYDVPLNGVNGIWGVSPKVFVNITFIPGLIKSWLDGKKSK